MFFIAEAARLAYISAVIDLAVSEAAKEAKNAPATEDGHYQARFTQRLTTEGGVLWGFVTSANAVEITIAFASSLEEIIITGGRNTDYHQRPIARYKLSYRYSPMFFPLPDFWATNLLNREVIFVQEYERSKFMH